MKTTVNIKPLSVNHCRQGRRFKTKSYKDYESKMIDLLPNNIIDDKKLLSVTINYYFSNVSSDIDNPTKPLLDILQKKYGFDDKRIFEKHEYKYLVPSGKERIDLVIEYCNYEIKKVKLIE